MRVGMMPPQGAPQPDAATRGQLVAWLADSLDQAAALKPNPGRPVLHRLNRAEYANAVRDLLALDVDPSTLLPPDDSAYGFDNVGDVLGVSPVLLERFMEAANKVSALAIGDPDIGTASETFRIRQDASQDTHVEGLPIGTVGGILAKVTLPLDAEYQLAVKMFRTNLGVMRGLEYEHDIEYTVDGARVHTFRMGGEADFKANLVNMTKAGDVIDERGRAPPETQGRPPRHRRRVHRAQRSAEPDAPAAVHPQFHRHARHLGPSAFRHADGDRSVQPDRAGRHAEPSRRVLVPSASAKAPSASERRRMRAEDHRQAGAARLPRRRDGPRCSAPVRLLRSGHAARRPARARAGRSSWAFRRRVQRMLASPKFCFHIEQDPAGLPPSTVFRVSDRELASRLSFFLWSSIPDTQLLDLAAQNRLHTPAVLEQQVKRMLADPKAGALTTNFAGQWLYLRNLKNMQPNSFEFPDFDDNLRQAFEREASLFFASIVHEDRNVLDLMTADYTFLNERLAKHYGIPERLRQPVPARHADRRQPVRPARQGRRAHGDVAHRSHLAGRARQVGARQPLERAGAADAEQRAAAQRRSQSRRPHSDDARADGRAPQESGMRGVSPASWIPIGLSMENFDAVGAWRTRDGDSVTAQGTPIDAQGELLDGTKVDGDCHAAPGAAPSAGAVRRHGDREADDLRPRPRPAAVRHAVGPRHRPGYRPDQLPLLVHRHGHRQQHAVPEARSLWTSRFELHKGAADVYFKDEAVPANDAPRHGRRARPAAARSDGRRR